MQINEKTSYVHGLGDFILLKCPYYSNQSIHLIQIKLKPPMKNRGLPCSSVGKESACSAGDAGLIPGLGKAPGEENGNPLQYPCLENLLDRGAWLAAGHGTAKSQA